MKVDPEMQAAVRSRSTGDILMLVVAATICFSVLTIGATVAFIRVANPEQDVSAGAAFISDTINTLIGLLAGFLAGRTDATAQRRAVLRDRTPDAED